MFLLRRLKDVLEKVIVECGVPVVLLVTRGADALKGGEPFKASPVEHVPGARCWGNCRAPDTARVRRPDHLFVAKLATTKGDTATVTAVTGLQELDLVVVVVVGFVGHRWLVLFEMNKLKFIGWTDLLFTEGGR
jgi:hypothetical protein